MATAPDIPGFTLLDVVGHGGFSRVYRAHQHSVDRAVAIKVDNRVLADERDRRRYLREVSAAGRLSGHPHVVAVFDAGTLTDGRPYLVMDLCPGGSLDRVLRREGPLPVDTVLGYGGQVADALAAAHEAGVLHRDIKPGNLLIGRYGRVGLADFGLASILSTDREQSVTREALTPAYASPESFRLHEPTPAADLYSLGATLYALLAGRPPRFPDGPAPSIHTIMQLHDQPVPDLPGVPAAVTAVLRRAMDSDPARRQPSAAALRDELAAIGHTGAPGAGRPQPVPAPPPPAAPPSPVPASRAPAPASPTPASPTLRVPELPGRQAPGPGSGDRRPRWVGPAAVAVAVAALGGGLFAWRGPDGNPPVITPAPSVSAGSPAARAAAGAGSSGQGSGSGGALVGDGRFAVPVTRTGCPATEVADAGAGCPTQPECWAGITVTSGSAAARALPCDRAHTWQTFAVALLPDRLTSADQPTAAADPTLAALCSLTVMRRSLGPAGRALPGDAWSVDLLTPSESRFAGGDRVVRCLAGQGLDRLDRPVFGASG